MNVQCFRPVNGILTSIECNNNTEIKKTFECGSKPTLVLYYSRKEERLACLDLQTLTVNVPLPATAPTTTLVNRAIADAVTEAAKAENIPEPPTLLRPRNTTPPLDVDASYPVALVPGQYSAKYRHYTAVELR